MAKVKDFFSGLSHCIAATFSIPGLVLLIVFASLKGNAFDIISFTIYGSSLFLMYLFSTLSHWINIKGKYINILKKFDYISKYLLIASTYITICLGPIIGPWGWSLFGVFLGLSILGIIFYSIWLTPPKFMIIPLNIAILLTIVILYIPTFITFSKINLLYSIIFLFIGDLFYFISYFLCNFNYKKTTILNIKYHETSHICIILGSILHYIFIIKYVLFI